MKFPFVTAVAACFAGGLLASDPCGATGASVDAAALAEARAFLSKMTLEEKVLLLSGNGTMTVSAIPRLGITREWTFSDNSHTVRADMSRWSWAYCGTNDHSTVLPTCSALGATWNTDLAALHGEVLGSELRERGKDQILGPGVNIMRSPLCGRNWEYMTEDPALAAKMVVPMIRAIQKFDVAATVKHFAVNNQEWNRNAVDTEVDERTLREIYLPAFRAAVQEAGCLSVMNAYNRFRGTFCSENTYLQRDILRGEWGFKGLVVTDWGAQHSTIPAALAGTDIEMNQGPEIRHYNNPRLIADQVAKTGRFVSDAQTQPLAQAVRDGKIEEKAVDDLALHVLYVMARTGFLSNRPRAKGERNTLRHQQIARAIGEEAIVLLKNEAGVLPLDAQKTKTLLLVGTLCDKDMVSGGWSAEGKPLYEITPLKGLREYLGDKVKIVRAPLVATDQRTGVNPIPERFIDTFDTQAKNQGMAVRAWNAAYWSNPSFSGEPAAKGFARSLEFKWNNNQPVAGIAPETFSVRFSTKLIAAETGKALLGVSVDKGARCRLLLDGRVVAESSDGKAASISADCALEKNRRYKVAVEYASNPKSPSRHCRFGWLLPSERGMTVDQVRQAAESADAILVFTGTTIGHGRAQECEGADRPNLLLPEGHDEAIEKILSWKLPNTVVINHSGSPMEFPWVDRCATLVQQPFLGQEAGRPLVRVLFGEVNPSGKLPCTWPRKLSDTPVATVGTYEANHVVYNEGIFVGYRWYDKKGIEPMFPFGHGLSYTTYAYAAPIVRPNVRKDGAIEMPRGGLEITVPVTNTGSRAGKEVVQLYVREDKPVVERPVRELKAFAKPFVPVGQTAQAVLRLSPRDLAYYDVKTRKFRAEAGTYHLYIAASSRDIRHTLKIRLPETWTE